MRLLISCFVFISITTPAYAQDTLLWSREPARGWTAAWPLGNGRLGAMVFGGLPEERIQLNEESLWAGEPFDVYPPDYARHLAEVQRLVLAGRIPDAQKYGLTHLTGSPTAFRSYQPLADLLIEFEHAEQAADYRRELDLSTGVACVRYRAGDITYTREMLISTVDDVIAVRLSASRPASIHANVRLARAADARVRASGTDRLHLDGQIVDVPAPEGYDDNAGGSGPGGAHMKFAGRLLARATGGHIGAEADRLVIDGADEVVLLFTAATDFRLDAMNFDRSIDPGAVSERILNRAASKPWADILRDHVGEHRSIFDRVSLELAGAARNRVPTDERIAEMKRGGEDLGLAALCFQFGRYLLMSASRRPGVLPANLQGIWNDQMWAAWESDYHLNINLQMNYWPAGPCNLSQTLEPLADWFERVAQKGRVSARRLYGADGWVAFTMVDLFGRTSPAGSTEASQFQNGVLDPLAGAWMATALWDHYTFTGDETFLRDRAYPVLKGACEFLLDILVKDPNGQLIIVPSTSPENSYLDPHTRRVVRITQQSTYHMSIVRAVFDATIDSSKILTIDESFRQKLTEARAKLPPLRIGKDGRLQEWFEEFEEHEPGHRHMSHLIGLYPFSQTTQRTPELVVAARKSLDHRLARGGGAAGWSRAWMISLFARLLDGDEAYRHLKLLLAQSTYANFFTHEPPWQIDCHLGATAGVAEMLLQSHDGEIRLLPALPEAWAEGRVRGLVARGAFVVDIEWKNGRVTEARIHSQRGGPCRVRSDLPLRVFSAEIPIDTVTRDELVVEFATTPGRTYHLRAASSE